MTDTPTPEETLELLECFRTGELFPGEGAGLVAGVRAMADRLAQIDEATRRAADETCGTDERHCTCVPLLRAENQRLRTVNAEAKREQDTLRVKLSDQFHCPHCGRLGDHDAGSVIECHECGKEIIVDLFTPDDRARLYAAARERRGRGKNQ